MGNKKRNKFKTKGEERREQSLKKVLLAEMYRDLQRDPAFRQGIMDLLDESRPAWTSFEDVTDQLSSPLARQLGISGPEVILRDAWGEAYKDVRAYQNSRYLVQKRRLEVPTTDGVWQCWQLSIKDYMNSARHDWRDLQRIKNELCGPKCEACEVYPTEERLCDTSNQYFLWVLPEGEGFPFGFQERCVIEDPGIPGACQRRFEPDARPDDLVSGLGADDVARLIRLRETVNNGRTGQGEGGQGDEDHQVDPAQGQAAGQQGSAQGQGEEVSPR